MNLFNRNRCLSLIIMIIIGGLHWYSTILLTNKLETNLPIPDNNQLNGLFLGLLISFLLWIVKCYTIKIEK